MKDGDPIIVTARHVEARAAWDVTLDGVSLTSTIAPRLISLRLSERRGEEADELEIVVHDHDGLFAPPPQGSILRVSLGWLQGTGVTPGLVDKGGFIVDELSWEGPPDRVSIRARSADFKNSFRTRINQVWKDTTLGAIVAAIAGRHGLVPRCHAELADQSVTAAEQGNKSDMQFLRDLARRYDATSTVKAGALIFVPIGATTTATGAALPTGQISRSDCSRYSWKRCARDKGQDGAEAQYHDTKAGKRETVSTGGTNKKRLKRVYASKADADAASKAEHQRLQRASASLDLDLSLGNPLLIPGMHVTVSDFKPHVDAAKWLIASADHQMDGRGLSTRLQLEVLA
jgi:phage protein D